jgi:hypothetical protein
MRSGYNPNKDKVQEKVEYIHQVILPVFIPNEEGYYLEAFNILDNCIQSLINTAHNKTFITIVNNGSCKKVVDYLNDLFEKKMIHELIHTENIGKLNAIFKGLSGNNIELVTISDSDVLFLENWQNETVNVFNHFPKAGVVGIVPQFRMFGYFCGNIILENLFSKRLKFTPVQDVSAVQKFYKGIGWDGNYNKDYLKLNLTIETPDKTFNALVGSGHFVATYKKILFEEIITYIGTKMGANSELYLDKAPLKKGLWRLTTNGNFAYHMGNVEESWMTEELRKTENILVSIKELKSKSKESDEIKILYFIKNRFFIWFFNKRKYRRIFYRFIGLPKEMVQKY